MRRAALILLAALLAHSPDLVAQAPWTQLTWGAVNAPGGVTNAAGANFVPKSDGTNLVASPITIDGATVKGIVGSLVPADLILTQTDTYANASYTYAITWVSSGIALTASGDKIRRSTDSGQTWAAVGGLSSYFNYPEDLADDPSDSTDAYVVTNGQGIYKTTDAGLTWNATAGLIDGFASFSFFSARQVTVNSTGTIALSAGAGPGTGGIARTTNGGTTWWYSNTGLTDAALASVRFAPSSATIAYAGNDSTGAGSGVYRSSDGGVTWARAGAATLTNKKIHRIAIHPTDASRVFACGPSGAYYSSDSGGTWTQVYPSGGSAWGCDSVAFDGTTVFAGFHTSGQNYGIWKSANTGTAWTPTHGISVANGPDFSRALAISGATLLVGTQRSGVYTSSATTPSVRSAAGGDAWLSPGSHVNGTTGEASFPAISLGVAGPSWTRGNGAPSGTCATGSLYSRTDGGTATTLYVCESAAWAAK